jgi:hypothetical protein
MMTVMVVMCVRQGNDELLLALERSKKGSKTFVTFVIVMACLLLLLDQIIP